MEYITHQRSLGFSPLRLEDKAFEVLNGATSIEHGANNSAYLQRCPRRRCKPQSGRCNYCRLAYARRVWQCAILLD